MTDRPISKRNAQLANKYALKLRKELITKHGLQAIDFIDRTIQNHAEQFIHTDVPFPTALENMSHKVKEQIETPYSSHPVIKEEPFILKNIPSKTFDQPQENVNPVDLIEKRRKDLFLKQQMLQIEESKKKRELQIAQRKTPIGNITSTFNLEEKWRDNRKAIQKSEMDCYQYNIEHLNKTPSSSNRDPIIKKSRLHHCDTQANSLNAQNATPLRQSIFKSVAMDSIKTPLISCDGLKRTKELYELSKKYNTNNVGNLQKLEYETHCINAKISHFEFA